uniref:Integrin, alpha 5 (fibronectin receptor, alpha polypeptide) n=1 Tax=Cyprinus carpio TaxID=7962 RepID=A0A8C1W2X6_CYPCA
MGSKRHRPKTSASSHKPSCFSMGLSLLILLPLSVAFNLDVENPAVYTGPNGSYFGYSVDFYMTDSSVSIIVGAPKANTSQPNIREGGSVFYCPWSLSQSQCSSIEFDTQGDLNMNVNEAVHQGEFKSHQWFGATVRVHEDSVLACAPLYSWRAMEDKPHADTTGSCYMSVNNFTKFVEYAPCRTEFRGRKGQGYCQGGFSADFTQEGKVVLGGPGSYFWQGQVITAVKQEIVKAYYPGYFLTSVEGQMQTKQKKEITFDDNYMGYSVAVGEFSGDDDEGDVLSFDQVSILNGSLDMLKTFTGEQMGSYFGYAVAATDINNDGMTDLLVGAPMFMVRDSDGRLEELGRVYVYMQNGPLDLTPQLPHLTGTHTFGRFGSSITPLGDLNQDGYNDVAISCPFGGENKQGLVLIYNGHAGGLKEKPSQVIAGQWASATPSALPASFGYAIRGGKDLDDNGYPDLIVGAFGANTAVLYRSRPIVNTSATLTVSPTMINPEEKVCTISRGNETLVNLSFCLSANGKHLPNHLEFNVEVQLDRLKQQQKGAVRRALFLDSQLPALQRTLTVPNGARVCSDTKIFLRDEKDFRDKLSPIFVALNFSLNLHAAADGYGLRPILNYQTAELIEQKAQILLDCGEDNICVPDLKISVKEVYMGDDNSLTLTFNAKNDGGGAYEAELYVVLPPEADYSGIARNNESLTQLTCSYETENQTRYLSCDLGNPMKSGTSVMTWDFTFINPLNLKVRRCGLTKQSQTETLGFSKTILPPSGSIWDCYIKSLIQFRIQMNSHNVRFVIFLLSLVDVLNVFSFNALLQNPYKNFILECLASYKVEKMPYAILPKVTPSGVVTPVVWNKPDSTYAVPLWIIILAILAGLLLLALLIYVLYKLGFFKRTPYGTAMEKAQLKPQAASEA